MPYFLAILLFSIGLYGVLRKRNIIKIIIGFILMEYGVNLLFIMVGYRMGGRSPILAPDQTILNIVDPLPQAIVLTAIVIGLGVMSLLVSLAIRLYDKTGTFDITKIRRLQG